MSKSKAPKSATTKTSDGGSTIAFNHKSSQQESSSSFVRNLKTNHQSHKSHTHDSSLRIIERTKPSTNQQNNCLQQKNRIKKLKCVFVGDDSIGKTSLIVSYTTNGYPADYVPTTFDTYSVLVTIDNKPCQLQLCDTAGQDDFDSIRPLCYNHADVFLVSFSVVSPRSFRNIRQKWLPEIRRTITNVSDGGNGRKVSSSRSMPPFILIGTQCDLRHDVKVLIELDSIGEQPISTDYAKSMAKKLGAIDYIECSALTQKNLKEVFDTAIIAGLEYQKNQSRLHKGEHHRYNHALAHHHQHQKHRHNTQNRKHDSKPKHYKSFTKIGPQSMIVANGGRSQTPPMANTCQNDYNYGLYKHKSGDGQGGANHDSIIYQDFYYHGRRHFVPTMPTKMANISDAKLVGWRKSLTKLSAQEALKSEAAEEAANLRNQDDEEEEEEGEEEEEEEEEEGCEIYHENEEYVEYPLVQPKLTTFSPLPSPIMSPKVSRKNIIMNKGGGTLAKSLQPPVPQLLVSAKSLRQTKSRISSGVVAATGGLFSDPEDDQGFHDETLPSDELIDSDEHRQHLHHNPKINIMKSKANHCHHFSNKQKTTTKIISSAKPLSCSCSSCSSSSSPCPQISSKLPSIPTPYDYSGCYGYKQTMIYNHNPYACYQTPYGTTVATTAADAPVARAPLDPIIYRSRGAPPTPVVIHNRSIFQPINGTNSIQSQSQQPPVRPMAKTNLATTLRSSSFFFLPSNTLKMMKQQRKKQKKEQRNKQLNGGKVIKTDSIVSSLSSTGSSSRSSISSCSSIHSSNELFKNFKHHQVEDGQQQHQHLPPAFTSSHRKSMLDMFHQIMSTSVTELRNRKCSNVFKRLASSLSSSGSGSSHNSTSSSSATSKEKQRLKSEKLKDLYYYDSYDYEEIDLDHRTAGKCCLRIWSLCCFSRNSAKNYP